MTFTSDTWCDFLSCPVQSQGTDLMTVLGPSQLQRSYESIHRDFLKGSHQATHCDSWSHGVAQVRGKILAQLNVFSWRGDQNMWQIFFLESSAERSPPRSVLPNVLHKGPEKGGDQWGEVCWWNYSRGKAKDKLEESYSTEQLLSKKTADEMQYRSL